MKRKIQFDITIGSFWESELVPERKNYATFPTGGEPTSWIVEFEVDEPSKSFDVACDVLNKQIGRNDYHIWYWTWLDDYDPNLTT